MTTDTNTLAPQLPHHLAGAVKRIFEEQLVDASHQRQVFSALPLCCVIERRSADRQNLALMAQTQVGVIACDHHLAFPPAHRLSPLAKKSRSTVNWPILASIGRSWRGDRESHPRGPHEPCRYHWKTPRPDRLSLGASTCSPGLDALCAGTLFPGSSCRPEAPQVQPWL